MTMPEILGKYGIVPGSNLVRGSKERAMIGNWRWLNKNGLIPAHTICPFKEQCQLADGCHHKGHDHDVPFSCAAARAFDITIVIRAIILAK